MGQFMEPLMIMSCKVKPSTEELAFFPELTILHATDLDKELVEMIEVLRASKQFTIQLVIGPVKITREVLLPAQASSLPFARPK
jgi:hypothetical protein